MSESAAHVPRRELVGRAAELELLRGLLDAGRAGYPRAIIIRGEAGIGKTRLVSEFLVEAAARTDRMPLVVATGQCVDMGPFGPPFAPIRRMLADLRAGVGEDRFARALGGPVAGAILAPLVPELAAGDPAPSDSAPYVADTVVSLLERLSAEAHLVLVIEDLQWADAATLALLNSVSHGLRGRHLTMVGTYRSDDVDRSHPLRPVIAEFERNRSIARLDLRPLSREETRACLTQFPNRAPSRTDSVFERSGGIPFFIEELAEAGDTPLSESLRDLVLARYERVGAKTQEVVRTMAVGGLHVSHEALFAVTALSDVELETALRDALDHGIIVIDSGGYRFRHALTREAVERELLPGESARVHRRFAEHLTTFTRTAGGSSAAIAAHWLGAGDVPRAFDAAIAAVAESRAAFAEATTAALLDRLLGLWAHVPDAEERAGITLQTLHRDAAQAHLSLSHYADGQRLAKAGIACDPQGDPVTVAALLQLEFIAESHLNKVGLNWSLLARAQDLLEARQDAAAQSLLATILGTVYVFAHLHGAPLIDKASALRRSVALAESAGDAKTLVRALVNLAWDAWDVGDDSEAALAYAMRARDIADGIGLLGSAVHATCAILNNVGRFDESISAAQGFLSNVDGIPRRMRLDVGALLVISLFAAGRAVDAHIHWSKSDLSADPATEAMMLAVFAEYAMWDDRPDLREELLEDTAKIEFSTSLNLEEPAWWALERSLGLLVRARDATTRDRVSAIVAGLATIAEYVERDHEGIPPYLRRQCMLSATLLLRAASRDGVPDASLRSTIEHATRAWPVRGNNLVLRSYIEALLADIDGTDNRVTLWNAVLPDIEGENLPVGYLHLARLYAAEALADAGRREDAGAVLMRIVDDAPGHGVSLVARWAREFATHAGIVIDRIGVRAGRTALGISSLTPREREVLALVAAGLTNPEIGKRLFISPKTASVHVSAILAKTGAANRAEAAALFAAAP